MTAAVMKREAHVRAARVDVPDRRPFALQVRQEEEAVRAGRHACGFRVEHVERRKRLAYARVVVFACGAVADERVTQPLLRAARERPAEREPTVRADVMRLDEAWVASRRLARHEEVARGAEHEARFALVD